MPLPAGAETSPPRHARPAAAAAWSVRKRHAPWRKSGRAGALAGVKDRSGRRWCYTAVDQSIHVEGGRRLPPAGSAMMSNVQIADAVPVMRAGRIWRVLQFPLTRIVV